MENIHHGFNNLYERWPKSQDLAAVLLEIGYSLTFYQRSPIFNRTTYLSISYANLFGPRSSGALVLSRAPGNPSEHIRDATTQEESIVGSSKQARTLQLSLGSTLAHAGVFLVPRRLRSREGVPNSFMLGR